MHKKDVTGVKRVNIIKNSNEGMKIFSDLKRSLNKIIIKEKIILPLTQHLTNVVIKFQCMKM